MKAERVQVHVETTHVYLVGGISKIPVDRGSGGGLVAEPYRVVVQVRDGNWVAMFVDAHRVLSSGPGIAPGPRVTRVFVPGDSDVPGWLGRLAELSVADTRAGAVQVARRYYERDLGQDEGDG